MAGISIGMLSGDNGVLKQAGNAKTQTDIAGEKEILQTSALAAMGKSKYGDITKEKIDVELNKNIGSTNYSSDLVEDGISITFTKSGRTYIVDSNGNIEKVPEATGIAKLIADKATINVGETTQLTATLNPERSVGTVTYSSSNTTKATVSDTGLVRGVAKGSTTITATVNGKSAEITIIITGPLVAGETAIGGSQEYMSDGKIAIIPEGFTISSTLSSINTGLVVTGPDGSEFVWIPIDKDTLKPIGATGLVNKPMARLVEGTTNYRGILYDFSTTNFPEISYSADSGRREPAYLKDTTNGDANKSINTIGITQDTLQQEYNDIIESIKTNGGFYVGRYETSLDSSNKVQSKGASNIKPIASNNTNTKMWWGLYSKQKTYSGTTITTTAVKSTMITGACYDAMLNWALNSGNDSSKINAKGNASHSLSTTTGCGTIATDKINNIYDLEGNVYEWTSEAVGTKMRELRGRHYWGKCLS